MKKHLFLKSLLIAIGLLIASINTAWAASPIYDIGDVYVTGSMNGWATDNANWKIGNGNHCEKTFYVSKSNSNYSFKLYLKSNYYTKGGYWYTKSNSGPFWSLSTSGDDMQIETKDMSSDYVALAFDFWGEYSGDSKLSVTQSDVSALSASLSASTTTPSGGSTSTLSSSCTGGSGSYTYSYVVTCGGSDVTASTLSATTGSSVTFTAPIAATAKTYTVTVTATDANGQLVGLGFDTDDASQTITVAATLTPSLNWAASSPVSPTTAVAGEDITLTVVRANSSADITYYYSTNSGSNWTSIETTSAQTCTFTTPANTGNTQSYIFKAEMLDGGTKSTGNSSAATVYGKKTIHVKNTNGWASMYVYAWDGSGDITSSWHGNTGNTKTGGFSCTSAGGQWWDVVITSRTTGFILNGGGSGDANQTVDLYYSTYTHDRCLEMGDESGKKSLSNTAATCPSAPSVTTASATSVGTTSVQFNASSVSANNDAITAYGFKWGTTSACEGGTVAASNLGSGTTFSATKSSLTNGTTYYFKAYATNGQGTTYGSAVSVRTKFITTVTLNPQGGEGGTPEVTVNEGSAMPSGKTAPTKWGYDFGGYYASAGGSGTKYYNANMSSANNWDVAAFTATIHAKWTAKSCTITLNNQGADSGKEGTTSQTTTYNTSTGLSTITKPVKTGWKFQGYWTATNGNGKQVIAADGSWNSDVATYMDDGKWVYDGGTTLYAYWVKASTYTFRYGTSGSEDWVGTAFTQVGATTTWQITNFTIPNKPNFYVGYEGLFYESNLGTGDTKSKSVTRAWTDAPSAVSGTYQGQMVLLPAGPTAGAIGQATGATGTLKIYTDSKNHNLYVGFEPSGYGVTRASGTLAFVSSSGTWRETNVVTLNSSDASGTFQVKLKTSSSYVATSHGAAEAASAVNGRKITGDADIANGKKGVFQMWTDATTNNFGLRFVTVHDVTFNMQGHGAAISKYSDVRYNSTISAPSAPSETGYTFGGWYKEPECMNAWNFGSDVVTAATTLYAKWTADTYTVSFNVNGGTASAPDSKEVTYGSAYGTLPSGMTHVSKTFVGWYTDPDDGEGDLITAETIVSTASNHTLYAHYENVYSVNVTFKCESTTIYPATSVNASSTSLMPTITAPVISGYSFTGWTESGSSYVTFTDASAASTTIKTTGAATVIANYSVVPTVYFKNNLGWENVYVTFDAYKDGSHDDAPGNYNKPYFQMTQIGSSDIYSCVIPSTYTASDYASWAWNIAFDNTGFSASDNVGTKTGAFDAGAFVVRTDFDPNATMYIPYNGETETRNGGTSYETGCWIQYNTNYSGYKVHANTYIQGGGGTSSEVELRSTIAGSTEFTATVNLANANHTYGVMLYKDYSKNTNNIWYTNVNNEANTITSATTSLPWAFYIGGADWQRCRVKTEALGDYKFTVSFATGKPMVNIEYPVQVGDWKLVYKDRATWSNGEHSASWYHPSRVIKAKAGAVDTVSFYVAYGSTPSVELHKCTAIDGETGAQTWTKQGDLNISSITATGIYIFEVTQNESKVASLNSIKGYTGNFYIRTDVSDGGWSNYKTSGANVMTYSEFAENNSGFTHYYMRYVNTGTNIKFCIANDYSECISDTLVSDTYTGEYIAAYGNVRFMWDHRTNRVSRAYISGSTNVGDRFLVLEGDAKMFDENGNALNISGLNANEMKFIDDQNWIYEATVKAQPTARIKLTAKYNNEIQYFYGAEGARTDENTELLIGGSGTDKYKVRVVYDFKTNRLIKAFVPDDGTISSALAIQTDLMIIREHQDNAKQILFSGDGALSEVKTVYGAMKFNKYTVNGKEKTGGHAATGDSRYKRDLFYISFPFDVKLNEAFGFGTYGQHWIIEYYDGKGRAKNGYWAESGPNWKFVTPSERNAGYTMKAFEGYILALELDEMAESASIWDNGVQDVYIYFPSDGNVNDIQATNRLIPITQEGYECTINRSAEIGGSGEPLGSEYDRTIKDSYWHCIGVPSFANYSSTLYDAEGGTAIDWSTGSLPYLYEWNPADNSLSIISSANFSFKATWSYLVQYAGEHIYWSSVNATPAAIVARERTAPKNAEFRIELQKAGEKADQTFVRLTEEENVTTGFEFNYDLSKEFNKSKANIYTLIGTEPAAGNVLPLTDQTTFVPVGVIAKTDGDYTFSIPDGTEGIGVTLIDNETGIRTSLSAVDYTINLSAGTYDDRFLLEISPIKHVATGIETVNEEGVATNGARKIMIDGLLYIVKDGKVFDAQGRQVK